MNNQSCGKMQRLRPIVFLTSALAWPLLSMSGCSPTFRQVESNVLEQAWVETENNSAESWWYAGERDGLAFFVKKTPMLQSGYRIKADSVDLAIQRMPFTANGSQWVNLKEGDLRFPGSVME